MVSTCFTLRFAPRAVSALALAAGAVLAVPAIANPAPAGTLIESTAEASYLNQGIASTATSNTVQVRVAEVLGVTVTPLDAGPVSARSGPATLAYRIVNTGNGPEAIALEVVTAIAGNGFEATLQSIARDTNGNGVYDSGVDEVLTPAAVTAVLAAGASETIFVNLAVPTGVGDGARSSVRLLARAATGTGAPGTLFAGAGAGGTDAIAGPGSGSGDALAELVASASTVTLVKWASIADPFGGTTPMPGAIITYGIEALVTGSASVDDLVVTDAFPASTQYVAGSLTLAGAPLTDAPGDDAGSASATGVRVDLGTMPGGAARTVTFNVTIRQ